MDGFRLLTSPERARALNEIHARPYLLVETPRVIIQLAFRRDKGDAVDRACIASVSHSFDETAPGPDANHYAATNGKGSLRWERHTEFSTYFWDTLTTETFGGHISYLPFDEGAMPGVFISGIRLELRAGDLPIEEALTYFDPQSLCYSQVKANQATILTDFRQDEDGLTRILVIDHCLTSAGRGALVQRLLDIETYRTFAMLGLPVALAASPAIAKIEDRFTAITQRMNSHARDEADELLVEMTHLAAELEASAASCLYRFGASRAYYDIVQERIKVLGEAPISGYETFGSFLERRLAPAMRTCRSVESRQAELSRKLARATGLLRSWIEVELERLNTTLLNSMDQRARLQLRLQQTVEGLSVAAISYYVVGLFGYVAKATHEVFHIEAETMTASAVPVALTGVWMIVRSIRRSHSDHEIAEKNR
ncbi:DUF3422 family protein [Rhizobium sp. BK060]|uniref:DUF3422 family protein n=1 Tax=Rhizobium sp. BK060 TaxID=2587096 RepID=UPI0016128148|nr:DUF3422 family protein [Rhizobium sp. BK060]